MSRLYYIILGMKTKNELIRLLLIDTIGIGSAYVAAAVIAIVANLIKENKRK